MSQNKTDPPRCPAETDEVKELIFLIDVYPFLFVFSATALQWARVSSFTRFLDHTQRRITVGRTPLDE